MKDITLYLMNQKGLAVLNALLDWFGPEVIKEVITSRDKNVVNDYRDEIVAVCDEHDIQWYKRTEYTKHTGWAMAVGWRWMLEPENLIVLHDSALPEKRGFAPLVSTLINGGNLGVTALLAGDGSYDTGPIIQVFEKPFSYPIKIQQAIEEISDLYKEAAIYVVQQIRGGTLSFTEQNEKLATYSLWRDEQDYNINWQWDAAKIKRHVDALGYPYKGASTMMRCDQETVRVRIFDVTAGAGVMIEGSISEQAGKVIFVRDGKPVVVCGGGGLITIDNMIYDSTEYQAQLKSFRTRFGD